MRTSALFQLLLSPRALGGIDTYQVPADNFGPRASPSRNFAAPSSLLPTIFSRDSGAHGFTKLSPNIRIHS